MRAAVVALLCMMVLPVHAEPPQVDKRTPAPLADEPPPPELPKKPDGTLDKEALAKELHDRDFTPEAIAARQKRLREEEQLAGYRVSPVFGSEQVFFSNLDRSQSAWGIIYRGIAGARYYLLAGLVLLAGFVVGGNWLR